MKKPLYIFLHMPKCAGSTFTYHIHQNLQPDEYIAMYAKDFCFGKKRIGDYYLQEAIADIKNLSPLQKGRLKVIFGHGIPYKIHRYFPDRDVRFITFLREPNARTISSYNFQRSRMHWQLSKTERTYYKQFIYEYNRPITFQRWLEKRYDKLPNLPVGVSMTTFLKELGYLGKGTISEKNIAMCVSRFWFIGLTEHFNRDVLWFYRELGIYKFYRNKNVSESFVKNTGRFSNTLSKRNKYDLLLYDHVRSHYSPLSVGSMAIIRAMVQPVTQGVEDILKFIYQRSAQLKQYIPAYKHLITQLKN